VTPARLGQHPFLMPQRAKTRAAACDLTVIGRERRCVAPGPETKQPRSWTWHSSRRTVLRDVPPRAREYGCHGWRKSLSNAELGGVAERTRSAQALHGSCITWPICPSWLKPALCLSWRGYRRKSTSPRRASQAGPQQTRGVPCDRRFAFERILIPTRILLHISFET